MKKNSPLRIGFGLLFALITVWTTVCFYDRYQFDDYRLYIYQFATIATAFISLRCFVPHKEREIKTESDKKLSKRTMLSIVLTLIAIPVTILAGVYLLGDRKYYFISILIIIETIIPFAVHFEKRKPSARELVVISVLCALGVAGRSAFFMIPQFKPVLAIVIISGVCFGGETGFLVGAVTGFVSNMFFGQGNWTPWQMFCFGIVGFVAGIVFKKGLLKKSRTVLCVFGGVATLVLYGGIINFGSVLMYQPYPTPEMIASSYAWGLPVDLIHAASTVFFLWFMAEPMMEKLERIKSKYGLLEK